MTNVTTDTDLYVRGAATLLASWEEYARGSAGAALVRLDGVSAAVFPSYPERAIYNNALLVRDLGPTERAAAVDAMEEAYNSAGIDRYAAWVHESDEGMRAELSSRGFTLDDSTRAMGMSLDDISLALPEGDQGRSRRIFCAASSSGLERRRVRLGGAEAHAGGRVVGRRGGIPEAGERFAASRGGCCERIDGQRQALRHDARSPGGRAVQEVVPVHGPATGQRVTDWPAGQQARKRRDHPRVDDRGGMQGSGGWVEAAVPRR